MRALLPALAVLVAACDSPAPFAGEPPVTARGVFLMTDSDEYARGGSVRLTLANGATQRVTTGVLECARLERWSGTAWALAPHANETACIEIARVLAPGEVLTGTFRADVPDGSYRLVHEVTVGDAGGSVPVATAAFRVE